MILVVLGTHGQQFNRLLQAIDALTLDEKIICQSGHSTYVPRHEHREFMSYDETLQLMRDARVVVCHAGTGTVMSALSCGKCPVVAPRLAKYGEHVDDHQLELVKSLEGLIVPYLPDDDLAMRISEAAEKTGQRQISPADSLVVHLHAVVAASAAERK